MRWLLKNIPPLHMLHRALIPNRWCSRGEIQCSKSIRIISLTIGRHFHLSPIPREISMKYCAQSRNMNCDRGISDSLALCSRICPWISAYMRPLYLKDRDWKIWKKSNNIFERKMLREHHRDVRYLPRYTRVICAYCVVYLRIAHIKCIFKSTFAKRTLISQMWYIIP